MTLSDIHTILGNALSLFALIIAVWATLQFFQQRELAGSFWGAIVIGQVLIVVQAVVGGIMLLQGARPARAVHFLYGAVTILTWPALFAFTKGGTDRKHALYWAISGVFILGVAFRAVATAGT